MWVLGYERLASFLARAFDSSAERVESATLMRILVKEPFKHETNEVGCISYMEMVTHRIFIANSLPIFRF
jgi:hypothetical protein